MSSTTSSHACSTHWTLADLIRLVIGFVIVISSLALFYMVMASPMVVGFVIAVVNFGPMFFQAISCILAKIGVFFALLKFQANKARSRKEELLGLVEAR